MADPTHSDFREDETVTKEWANLTAKAWDVYNCLDASAQSSFFQLVLHPVRAVYTVILIVRSVFLRDPLSNSLV